MPVDLLSFLGSTLSFATAISWNDVAREVIHQYRPAPALGGVQPPPNSGAAARLEGGPQPHPASGAAARAAVAIAVAVTLVALLVTALADWGWHRLDVGAGGPPQNAGACRACGRFPCF